MAIHTTCPTCCSLFELANSMGGKQIRCGKCQAVFTVPARELAWDVVTSSSIRSRSAVPPPIPPPARHFPPSPLKHNHVPWIVGGIVACVGMMTLGAIVVAILLRDRPLSGEQASHDPVGKAALTKPAPEKPAGEKKVKEQSPAPQRPSREKPPEKPVRPKEFDPSKRNGEMSREALDAVKEATVYLRVILAGSMSSGTGFFGAPGAPNIVVTNAHVVGMLAPDSVRPRRIEVVINSGQKNERVRTARVLAVDRVSDLAVLDLGTREGMPNPLTVKSAERLRELDKVYVFGFPLGERLGKEITVRPSSVSALRKRNGVLDRIQVNGGMDPGNSGGPVVDDSGQVVGVAVSGIQGRAINFAIPGEYVHAILKGRIANIGVGQPFKEGARVALPVLLEMSDPRGQIKEVALEVWTGNLPADNSLRRPSSETAPEARPGDSERKSIELSFRDGIARADVRLPVLPDGKVYWLQPVWKLAGGERRWASAAVYRLNGPPLERRAVILQSRYTAGAAARRVSISITNRLRVGSEAESEVASASTQVVLKEQVTASSETAVKLTLAYQSASRSKVANRKTRQSAIDPDSLPLMRTLVELDEEGSIRQNTLANLAKVRKLRTGKDLIDLHEAVKQGLESLLLPLPNRMVAARETWKLQRLLGVEMPDAIHRVQLDLTCAYLGVRGTAGEEEAVIGIEGPVRDKRITGQARGLMTVDVTAGVVKRVELNVTLDIPAVGVDGGGKKQQIKVRSTMALRLERGL